MELRTLGATDLSVTRIGLGLAALGRPGYINLGHAEDLHLAYEPAVMEAGAHAVLDAAWQAGVRYFDAARSYGNAESFLASWLTSRKIAPEEVTIGSKWGYTYTAGWQVKAEAHEIKDPSLPVLLRQVKESKNLLGPYLDLYQIHSATIESGVLDNKDVLLELAHLQETGLKIGLTLTGPNQAATLRKALEVVVAGKNLFQCVQATYNLLEPSLGPLLQVAHDGGLGVIIKEALANGRLTKRNTDPSFAVKLGLLQATAERLQTSVDALALRAVLQQPWVDVVLSGAATAEHLRSNLAALALSWDDACAAQLRELAETPQDYWQRRGRLAWN